jgi:GNAT superfamily N-acetyltransferase
MTVDPDLVAAALADTWQRLFEVAPLGWMQREAGAFAGATGVPIATPNGIWLESRNPDGGTVAAMFDRLDASGLPYCLQLRPGTPREITDQALKRGMTRGAAVPLMVLEVPTHLPAAREVEGLNVRVLEPEDIAAHVQIAAGVFGVPEELFASVMTRELMTAEGLRCYVGAAGTDDVTTAMGVTLGSGVGVSNVATLAPYRGRGYGAAITARVVSDALLAGAEWAWLQASPAGYRVYERLGFVTVDRWECFASRA